MRYLSVARRGTYCFVVILSDSVAIRTSLPEDILGDLSTVLIQKSFSGS